jgi:hypothetical protein
MKVIKNHSNSEDPINYLNFEKFESIGGDYLFFYGGHPHDSVRENPSLKKYFFSTEEQSWDLDTTDNNLHYLDKIFTICPPEITGRNKREYVFFPFPEEFIPTTFNKIYDVIYTGSAQGEHVDEIVNTINKFNYRFISFNYERFVTNFSVSYFDKIKFISESKIDVIHNLTGNGTPQIKTRAFEAAFCKSLILCKKDNWNIIEKWFEPNKEFLYFENEIDLENLITEILKNYDKYQIIINNAYNKAINNYTTRHFVEKYLK